MSDANVMIFSVKAKLKQTILKFKKNWQLTILLMVLLFAAFFRLYNLKGTLQFQGDQGRDAMIVADIFKKKDLVFIGPVTSVGNMYLGPIYYYFMLPFLMISYPSPMGPVYAVALLGILTVFLTYKLGKELIGRNAALIASIFLTLSATAITYTRFSWNPNPAPLIALLMLYCSYKALKNPKYYIGLFICFSIIIQLHYLATLAMISAGVIWLYDFGRRLKKTLKIKKKAKLSSRLIDNLKHILFPTYIGLMIFLLSLSPLVLFDIKHDYLNLRAFSNLLTKEENFIHSLQGKLTEKITRTVKETEGRSLHILFEYNVGKNRSLNRYLNVFVYLILLGLLITRKKRKTSDGEAVLIVYLLIGILGTSLYQHTIFDHYIAYLFPITALIYGLVLNQLNKNILGKILSLIFFIWFLNFNLQKMPLKTLGWTIDDIKKTSDSIAKRVMPEEKYNIVLLSQSKDIDGQNYRYFLTTTDNPPVEIEQRGEVETLFIINEEKVNREAREAALGQKKTKKVTDLPIYEIVVFPNKEPVEIYQIENGPEITVLRK